MKISLKKSITSVVAISLLILTLQAKAILPFLVLPVITLLEGASTMQLALTGSVVIHAAVLAIKIHQQGQEESNPPLQIILDPNKSLITPSGWTAPVLPAVDPTPPSSLPPESTTSYQTGRDTSQTFSTPEAACARALEVVKQYQPNASISGQCVIDLNDAGHNVFNETITTINSPSCAPGYAPSYATCNLVAANEVRKPIDNICETRMYNGSIVPDARDPDCAAQSLEALAVSMTNNQITVAPPKGTTKDVITMNPDGSTTVEKSTLTSDGNTKKDTVSISPGTSTSQPTVTGVKSEIIQGQGSLSFSPSGSGSGSSPLDISSLNKEATQSLIKNKLGEIKDELHSDMYCDTCTLPTDKTAEQKADIDAEIKKTTDSLANTSSDYSNFKEGMDWSTWVPTFPSGSCEPFTKTVMGKVVVWDMCPYIAKLNALIGWLFSLFGAWTITSMFFSKD